MAGRDAGLPSGQVNTQINTYQMGVKVIQVWLIILIQILNDQDKRKQFVWAYTLKCTLMTK